MTDDKLTLDGSEAVFIDCGISKDEDNYENYEAKIVTPNAILPTIDGTPGMIDTRTPGCKYLNMSAAIDQYDEKIKERLDDDELDAVDFADELVSKGIYSRISGTVTKDAVTEEIRSKFRAKFKHIIIERIYDMIREAKRVYLFVYEATLPKGSKPGAYRTKEPNQKIDRFENGKPVWIDAEPAEEKTVQEIVDNPMNVLRNASFSGKRTFKKPAIPLDILDAHPDLKQKALSLLVNPEGGIQPIWRITDGNFASVAVTEETDAGLRIKGIGQIVPRIKITADQVKGWEDIPANYSSYITDVDTYCKPEWNALFKELKAIELKARDGNAIGTDIYN